MRLDVAHGQGLRYLDQRDYRYRKVKNIKPKQSDS